jgi:kynurenine formamidase
VPRRLVDISSPLKAGIQSDPPHMLPKIEYMDHHQTAPAMAEYMGVRVDQLPDGEYAAVERAEISTHNGTHMDAPYHFFSSMNHALKPGGEPSWRIDDVPLDWCFQPGVKLDFRHLPDGYVATPGDVAAELKGIGHELRPLEIVVINTAAGARYGQDDFVDTGCGMGKAATMWLTERGVRVVGTDA